MSLLLACVRLCESWRREKWYALARITRVELLVCRLAEADFILLFPLTLSKFLLGELQLVLESRDFLGDILCCLCLALRFLFWLCNGRTSWSWRSCWLSLWLWLWFRLCRLFRLWLLHWIGWYLRLCILVDFLICSKAPALLEQTAKDTFLHLFGVGRDEHDALPAATVKIATQRVRIGQRRPHIQIWIAHTGILTFFWRACTSYGCGCG